MKPLKQHGNEGVHISPVTMTTFVIAFLIAQSGPAVAYDYVETASKLCPESHVCPKSNPNNQNLHHDVSDDGRSIHGTDRMSRPSGGLSSDVSISGISANSPSRNPTTSSTMKDNSATSFNNSGITQTATIETTDNAITSSTPKSDAISNADPDNGDMIPCCHPCSCDSDCQQSGTCCPGAEQLSNPESITNLHYNRKENMAPANCLRPTLDNFHRLESSDLPWYKVISRCPIDYTDDKVISKCMRSKKHIHYYLNFDDAVMVSDSADPDTIFLNRHCAACNDVMDVIRWTMKVIGVCYPNAYEDLRHMAANSASNYILYQCSIVSEPHHIKLTARAACRTNLIKTCNVTGQWDVFSSELEKACDSSDVPYLDPYVRSRTFQTKYTQYRNVYCFLCNQPAGVSRPNECSRRQLGLATKTYPSQTTTVVLDTEVFINRTYHGICSNQLMDRDPVLNICMLYHCGIGRYGHHNKCIRLSKQTYGVDVEMHLMLKPTANVTYYRSISQMSSGDQLKFQNWLLQTIGITACDVSDLEVKVYRQENYTTEADLLKAIVIVADITTNVECTLDDIVDVLLLKSKHNGSSFPVYLDGSNIGSEDNLEFSATIIEAGWQAPEIDNNEIAIAQMNRGNSLKMNLTSRFYCPHYILEYSQYCQYSEFVGQPCPAIKSWSGYKLLPGFSLISTTPGSYSVLVCKHVIERAYRSLPPVKQTTLPFKNKINPAERPNAGVFNSGMLDKSGDFSNLSSTPTVSVTEMDTSRLNWSDIDSFNVDWFNFDSYDTEPSDTGAEGGLGQATTPVGDVSRGLRREMSVVLLTACIMFPYRRNLFW